MSNSKLSPAGSTDNLSFNGESVLVTGAGGFIGSHLCRELVEAGAKVRALVRYSSHGSLGNLTRLPADVLNEIEIVRGNVEDMEALHRQVAGTTVVFHLAALIGIPYSYHAPRSYVRTNIEGTLNVLECARSVGLRRLVFCSTSEVYGSARQIPIREDHVLQGQSPYSASKIAGEKLVESYHLSFRLPVVTVRPFNTYGPGQSARAVLPSIIAQAWQGEEIRLGNLSTTRDLTYVTDTCQGLLRAGLLEGIDGLVCNLGTGKSISIGNLANLVLSRMNVTKPVVCADERLRPEASEVQDLQSDNRLARERLGWSPQVSLEEGLDEVIASLCQPQTATVASDPRAYIL
jgi:dTDP-glucose 4,6-dehydratase